jgi:hypothetical protein
MITECGDDVDLEANEFGGKVGKLLRSCSGMPELDDDVPALDEVQLTQRLSKRLHPRRRRW